MFAIFMSPKKLSENLLTYLKDHWTLGSDHWDRCVHTICHRGSHPWCSQKSKNRNRAERYIQADPWSHFLLLCTCGNNLNEKTGVDRYRPGFLSWYLYYINIKVCMAYSTYMIILPEFSSGAQFIHSIKTMQWAGCWRMKVAAAQNGYLIATTKIWTVTSANPFILHSASAIASWCLVNILSCSLIVFLIIILVSFILHTTFPIFYYFKITSITIFKEFSGPDHPEHQHW